MHKLNSTPRAAMPLLLALLLTACATPPAPLPPAAVPPPQIPPLPAQARQPTAPAICSPSCSAALGIWLQSLQEQLTPPAPPASPASGPMTP